MRPEILLQSVSAARRTFVGWSIGLAAFVIVNVATYPAVRGREEFDEAIADMPEALLALFGIDPELSLSSPEGYLVSQLFGFLLPMLFVVLGVVLGARVIAGEEERGTLELLLAHPVSRWRVAIEKLGALVAVMAAVGLVTWGVMAASAPVVDLDAGLGSMGVATLASLLFGVQSGVLAYAVGAGVGKRAPALAVAAGVAVAAFVVESLSEIAEALEPLRWASPFHYANGNVPMANGLRGLDVAVLLAIIAVTALAGVVAFGRRDIGT